MKAYGKHSVYCSVRARVYGITSQRKVPVTAKRKPQTSRSEKYDPAKLLVAVLQDTAVIPVATALVTSKLTFPDLSYIIIPR
jgi:hypothetical protein